MSYVVQKIFVNVPRGTLQKSRENVLPERVVLVRDAKYIVEADLLDDAEEQAGITLDASSTFSFRIDNSSQVSKSDIVLVGDSDFNIGADRNDLNVAHGKICFRLDLSGVLLQKAMEYVGLAQVMGALWVTPPAEDAYMQFQVPLTIVNSYTEAP